MFCYGVKSREDNIRIRNLMRGRSWQDYIVKNDNRKRFRDRFQIALRLHRRSWIVDFHNTIDTYIYTCVTSVCRI